MRVLPPESECERQNPEKLEKVAFSHFFDSLRTPGMSVHFVYLQFVYRQSSSAILSIASAFSSVIAERSVTVVSI